MGEETKRTGRKKEVNVSFMFVWYIETYNMIHTNIHTYKDSQFYMCDKQCVR